MGPIAGEIAQAFVRIRPNTTGFQQETESGVKKALFTVGKITAGFFALRGLADEIKHIEEAATEHQAQFAVLNQTLKNAHASATVLGTGIEKLLEKEATLKGFTDEELASSFTRLVSVTGDSVKAFHALQDAEDVARARHIDVATAALAESRALQGSTISLSRLGVIIPKVSTEQKRLRDEQARAAAEGVKLTGQQKLQFQAHLATAAAADAQATKVKALAILEQRFGGSAEAFAKGAAGRIERFSASFHLFEVAVGKAFLPVLAQGTTGLTQWVNELRASGDAQSAAAGTAHFIRDAFVEVRGVVQTLAPVLRPVVELLADIAKFAGAGGILVFAAAFKTASVALQVAASARAKFIELSASDVASSERSAVARQADAAAIAEATPALERRAAATDADAAASARATASIEAYTVALRENSAALAADSEQAIARARLSTTASLAPAGVLGIAPVGAAASPAVLAGEASAATQGAEALRELGQSASDASPPIIAATGSIGDLAIGVDSSTAILDRGRETLQRHAEKVKSLTRETKGLNSAQEASATVTTRNSAALNAEAASADRLAASTAAAAGAERGLTSGTTVAPLAGGVQAVEVAAPAAAAASASAASDAESQANLLASTIHHSTQVFDRAGIAARGNAEEVDNLAKKESGLSAAAKGAANSATASADGFSNAGGSAKKAAGDLGEAEQAAAKMGATGGRISTVLKNLGRSMFTFVGGWPTVVVAALGLTAFGIYKLITAESALDRANRRVTDSINAIASGLHKEQAATKALADDRSSLKSDQIALVEAKIGAQRAANAIATSKAGRATLEYRQLVADLASAQDQLRLAERNVNQDEAAIAKDQRHRGDAAKNTTDARNKGLGDTLSLLHQIGKEVADSARVTGGSRQRLVPTEAEIARAEKSGEAAKRFADGLRADAKKAADEGHNLIARQFLDLANLVAALGKVPERKVIEVFFKAPKTSIAQTIAAQIGLDLPKAQAAGAKGIAAFVKQLDHERETIGKNDPQLARHIRIVEELARVAGKRIAPRVISFILRSNVDSGIRRLVAEFDRAGVSAKTFREELGREAASLSQSNPALARKLLILSQFSTVVGRLPSKKETELVFKAPTVLAAATGLQGILQKFKEAGGKSGDALARQFLISLVQNPFLSKGLADELPTVVAANARADSAISAAREATLKGELATARKAVETAKAGVDSARQSLQGASNQLTDAQTALVDAIKSGQQQVAAAVRSAGANLTSIGSSLSSLVGQFFDEQQARLDAKAGGQQHAATGPLAERLKRLRALIAEGKGSPQLIREAEQVEAELQALADKQDNKGNSALDKRKERVQRRLNDLTDEFNTGKISVAKFTREVLALLKHEGINYKSAGRLLGVAFADGFRQAVRDIKAQAEAIAKFGRLPGVSGQSDIVRPSQVAKDVQTQIARDQLGIERQQRDVLRDQKTLQAKEATLAKANAKADGISTKIGNLHTSAAKTASNTGVTNVILRQMLAQVKEVRAQQQRDRKGRPTSSKPEIQGGFAGGGIVPGHRTRQDSVVAALSPGEAVLTDHGQGLVDQMGGRGAMDWILRKQRPHFASGGRVEGFRDGGPVPSGVPSHWNDSLKRFIAERFFHYTGGILFSKDYDDHRNPKVPLRPTILPWARQTFSDLPGDPQPYGNKHYLRASEGHNHEGGWWAGRLASWWKEKGYKQQAAAGFRDGGVVPPGVPSHWNDSLKRFIAERYFHYTGGILFHKDYNDSRNPKVPLRPTILPWARETFSDLPGNPNPYGNKHYRRSSEGHDHEGGWWAGRLASWWKEKGFRQQKEAAVPRFGDGGIVDRPTVIMAGEKGPEAIVPLRRGGRTPGFASGGLVETGLLRFVAEAEERGALFRGETTLTILVNADARPARRVLDELRRAAPGHPLPRPRIEDDLRRAIPPLREADPLRRDDPRREFPPGGRIAIPVGSRERRPLVPPLDPTDVARTQRDAMLREERAQTRILERIARDEAAQTILLRDVELDVRPRRVLHDHRKNLRVASDRALIAARNNLIG